MASERQIGDRSITWLMVAYAIAAFLLVSVSARLWWQSPLNLTAHEFDYFLGLFASSDSQQSQGWVARGRIVHFAGCLAVGLLYFALVTKFLRSPKFLTDRICVYYGGLVALIFALGMPWVSPDVFFYIGKGWAESHYGVSPYLVPITHLPGYQADEMFANIYPGFLGTATGYGPLFQKASEVIAALSGGNERLALGLHKAINFGLHGACSFLVYRLAPAQLARIAGISYALNPLICFSVLTSAHNDHWMNMLMLLALLSLSRRHWAWTGVAVGLAFGVKYFPLVYVPVIGLAALVQRRDVPDIAKNFADASKFAAGFLATVAASFFILYPEAIAHFAGTLDAGGAPVYRNSIYHLINTITALALPNILGMQPFALTSEYLQELGASLRLTYVAIYAIALLLLLRRLRSDAFIGSIEGCLVVTILYFMVANTSNQEWYLTWLLGFAFTLPYAHSYMFAVRLSAYFLPLVIYTVKSDTLIAHLISNTALYSLVLILGLSYLWASARRPSEAAKQRLVS